MSTKILELLLLGALLYATYNVIVYGYPELFQNQSALYQTHHNIWTAQRYGANRNYEFQFTDLNRMSSEEGIVWPITVTVRDNVVVLPMCDGNGNPVSFLTISIGTIDEFFDLIQRALADSCPWIHNTYNASVGYPDSIDMVSSTTGRPQRFILQNYRAVADVQTYSHTCTIKNSVLPK